MAERPEHAPRADTHCEVCGEELGEYWGVTRIDFSAGLGRIKTYQPIHSQCWWETHPDERERVEKQIAIARGEYEFKRVPTRREREKAEKKRAEMEARIS